MVGDSLGFVHIKNSNAYRVHLCYPYVSCVLQCSTTYLWHSGARASFRIALVLVLPQEYDEVIVLSGKISVKKDDQQSLLVNYVEQESL